MHPSRLERMDHERRDYSEDFRTRDSRRRDSDEPRSREERRYKDRSRSPYVSPRQREMKGEVRKRHRRDSNYHDIDTAEEEAYMQRTKSRRTEDRYYSHRMNDERGMNRSRSPAAGRSNGRKKGRVEVETDTRRERRRSSSTDHRYAGNHRNQGRSRSRYRRRNRSSPFHRSYSRSSSVSSFSSGSAIVKRHRHKTNHRHDRDYHGASRRRRPSRRSFSTSPPPPGRRANGPLPSQIDAFTKPSFSTDLAGPKASIEKQKPNYGASGLLAAETNTVAGTSTVLKYNEPPEARLPPASAPWRLYVFKGKDVLETIELHTRSCWLFGRERTVVDVPTEHPSCSKQHAVIQFRYVEKRVGEYGDKKTGVRPYVIDLESANGTIVNGERIPEAKFVEVKTGDVVNFGQSAREYVVLLPPKDS